MIALLTLLALSSLLAVASTATAREDRDDDRGRREGRTILEFDTMTPVVDPFTGPTHAIRGIGGGGVPWAITRGEGELKANGELEVRVVGLIIPAQGFNPVQTFVAAVNCLTIASPDTGVTLLTPTVPVGRDGNARFEARLNLPHPCVAPIVFVGTPAVVNNQPSLRWFATTGA